MGAGSPEVPERRGRSPEAAATRRVDVAVISSDEDNDVAAKRRKTSKDPVGVIRLTYKETKVEAKVLAKREKEKDKKAKKIKKKDKLSISSASSSGAKKRRKVSLKPRKEALRTRSASSEPRKRRKMRSARSDSTSDGRRGRSRSRKRGGRSRSAPTRRVFLRRARHTLDRLIEERRGPGRGGSPSGAPLVRRLRPILPHDAARLGIGRPIGSGPDGNFYVAPRGRIFSVVPRGAPAGGVRRNSGGGGPRRVGIEPERYSKEAWEAPRATMGLKLVGELAQRAVWKYVIEDDSRRSYAAYLPNALTMEQSQSFFDRIHADTKWAQPMGSLGPIPRKTAWLVSSGCVCSYSYGGVQVESSSFPPWMLELMEALMPRCGISSRQEWPNSCNLNLYDHGGMSVGWHADDEQLFQGKFKDVRIISLSLGATRTFEMRANWPEEGEQGLYQMKLRDGDLCTMEGMLQKHYQHRVPNEGNVSGARINLTWRWVVKHTPYCPVSRGRR